MKIRINSFANFVSMSSLLTSLIATAALATDLPRVSVLRFKDEGTRIQEGCRGYLDYGLNYQEQLQSQLEVALIKAGFKVQERREVNQLYNSEHELVNSKRVNRPKKNGFKSAQFSIAGALTEFGLCTSSSQNKIQLAGVFGLFGVPQVSDLSLGAGEAKSKVGLVVQIIDVETAENIAAFTAHAEAKESGGGVSFGVMGIGGSHHGSNKELASEASRNAIDQLVAQIKAHFETKTAKN